jgi:hypothetical protein
MGRRRITNQETDQPATDAGSSTGRINIGELLSEKKPPVLRFRFWIVGDTPLICHAWSQKAKLDMLKAQGGATASAKAKRDPEQDFLDSLYEMGDGTGVYGFPITAVKKAFLACAHKDRGIPRSDVMQALWLDAEMISVRPALKGAICDMPLVRIYGSEPVMREDMVRIGVGLRKTANLAYRGQFTRWALPISGNINPLMVEPHHLVFLGRNAGTGIGIGDWRNEKGGWFGAFHIADPQEQEAWEKYAAGKGPLPKPKKPMDEAPLLDAAE